MNKILMFLCIILSTQSYADTFVILYDMPTSNYPEQGQYVLSAEPLKRGDKIYPIEKYYDGYMLNEFYPATVLKQIDAKEFYRRISTDGQTELNDRKTTGWRYVYFATLIPSQDVAYHGITPGFQSNIKFKTYKFLSNGLLPSYNEKYRYQDKQNCAKGKSGVVTAAWGKYKISFLNVCGYVD